MIISMAAGTDDAIKRGTDILMLEKSISNGYADVGKGLSTF